MTRVLNIYSVLGMTKLFHDLFGYGWLFEVVTIVVGIFGGAMAYVVIGYAFAGIVKGFGLV